MKKITIIFKGFGETPQPAVVGTTIQFQKDSTETGLFGTLKKTTTSVFPVCNSGFTFGSNCNYSNNQFLNNSN